MKLVAIDFETADRSADSACAIGIVSIEKNKITQKGYRLIRPPRRHFVFSYIHGISWADVEAQPTFNEVWDHFASFWKNADYFLAHYASFDRNVLAACCSTAGRRPPRVPFICTVRVARSHWNFRPANLPAVCTQLGISLKHHDASSDALACASHLSKAGSTDERDAAYRAYVERVSSAWKDAPPTSPPELPLAPVESWRGTSPIRAAK
jgi:DNA polymerase-3 subunit epsilon